MHPGDLGGVARLQPHRGDGSADVGGAGGGDAADHQRKSGSAYTVTGFSGSRDPGQRAGASGAVSAGDLVFAAEAVVDRDYPWGLDTRRVGVVRNGGA